MRHDRRLSERARTTALPLLDTVQEPPLESRAARLQSLRLLYELFKGHDAGGEVARLKAEDEGS